MEKKVNNKLTILKLSLLITFLITMIVTTVIMGNRNAVDAASSSAYDENGILWRFTYNTDTWEVNNLYTTSLTAEQAEDLVIPSTITLGGYPYTVRSVGYGTSSNGYAIPKTIKKLTIPDTVTAINNYAFQSQTRLEELVMGSGIKTIGTNAFAYCYNLQGTLTLGENVVSIGNNAFANCSKLKGTIDLHEGLTTIGASAFYYCPGLTGEIVFPKSLTSVGNNSFGSCTGITGAKICDSVPFSEITNLYSSANFQKLEIYDDSTVYKMENGCLYSKDGKRLLKAPKNIVEYNIKEDAIVIDDNAFSWCKELTKIIISSSIKKIGERAFWCCRSLEQMIIPDSVIEIGIEAFEGCESLKQIVIPNSITSIPNRAFSSCSSLLSISIPMSVTHIGEFAFDDCNSLETISLPESVSSIGKDAFQDCWNLMQISIPNSITKISEYTFLRCSSLIQVNIPESVQIIEDGAFMGCTKLQSISLPIGIKSIGDATFATCYNLDEMFIPEGVESIGANAFLNCVKLNKVWLSNKVTFIDPSAFTGCKKLEYIFIPDNTFVKFEKLLPEYREILMEKVEIDGHKGLKRFLSKKELEVVYKAKVVQGQYTKLICFYMNDGCQKYIPLCKQSQLSIGDEVDLNKAKLIELSGEGIYYGYMDGREYYDKNIVDA